MLWQPSNLKFLENINLNRIELAALMKFNPCMNYSMQHEEIRTMQWLLLLDNRKALPLLSSDSSIHILIIENSGARQCIQNKDPRLRIRENVGANALKE